MATATKNKTRNRRIAELRDKGHTLEAIGSRFGVSRQRIHQILKGGRS
jgi:DNA-directed RNA polymerase sigma subunit (sigma70/sigma32)